jgi:hypothetical protein
MEMGAAAVVQQFDASMEGRRVPACESSCKHGLICCLIGVGTRSWSGYAIVGPISELLCRRQ